MKTMINKTILLLFIAVALASCSKEDDCDPEDENSPCYVGFASGDRLFLVEEKNNGKTEMRFEYNDQNQVIVRQVHGIDGSIAREDFTYIESKLSKVEHSSDNQLVMIEEYFYKNNSDMPSTGLQKTNKGEILSNIIYTYSGNNVAETFYNKEGKQVGLNTSIFDDKGKNIVKVISTLQNIMLFTLEYADYDAKPCRYTNYPWAWRVGSVNNAQSYTLTSHGLDGTVSTKNDRWKYTYNAAGYPTKAEVYDKVSNKLVETREFIYKKAN